MQQAECDVTGTVLYSLASSPPYFCNQTQGCAGDRDEHRTVYSVRGMYGVERLCERERERRSATKINPAPLPLLMSACSLLMLS